MLDKKKTSKVIASIIGVLLVGCGIAINNGANLGNDPVGIFYDGIRMALNLSYEQLNIASSIVNVGLLLIVFLTGRKYVNIGTLIYILPYGLCISLGTIVFKAIPGTDYLIVRILCSALGCCLLYFGVAIFIVADIGLDPFTGLSMVIANCLGKDFRVGKWITDFLLTLIGFLLHGTLGTITIFTLIAGGPLVSFFSRAIKRVLSAKYH